jgi:hypothetical protein
MKKKKKKKNLDYNINGKVLNQQLHSLVGYKALAS